MKVLTVRQPWASAIIWGGKDIDDSLIVPLDNTKPVGGSADNVKGSE